MAGKVVNSRFGHLSKLITSRQENASRTATKPYAKRYGSC